MSLDTSGAPAIAGIERTAAPAGDSAAPRRSGYSMSGRADRLAQMTRLAALAALAALPLVWLVDILLIVGQQSMRLPGSAATMLSLDGIATPAQVLVAVLHSADLIATAGVLWVLQGLCARFRGGFAPLVEIGQDLRSMGSWFGLAAVIQAAMGIGLPVIVVQAGGQAPVDAAFEFNLTAIGAGAILIVLGVLLEQSGEEG